MYRKGTPSKLSKSQRQSFQESIKKIEEENVNLKSKIKGLKMEYNSDLKEYKNFTNEILNKEMNFENICIDYTRNQLNQKKIFSQINQDIQKLTYNNEVKKKKILDMIEIIFGLAASKTLKETSHNEIIEFILNSKNFLISKDPNELSEIKTKYFCYKEVNKKKIDFYSNLMINFFESVFIEIDIERQKEFYMEESKRIDENKNKCYLNLKKKEKEIKRETALLKGNILKLKRLNEQIGVEITKNKQTYKKKHANEDICSMEIRSEFDDLSNYETISQVSSISNDNKDNSLYLKMWEQSEFDTPNTDREKEQAIKTTANKTRNNLLTSRDAFYSKNITQKATNFESYSRNGNSVPFFYTPNSNSVAFHQETKEDIKIMRNKGRKIGNKMLVE